MALKQSLHEVETSIDEVLQNAVELTESSYGLYWAMSGGKLAVSHIHNPHGLRFTNESRHYRFQVGHVRSPRGLTGGYDLERGARPRCGARDGRIGSRAAVAWRERPRRRRSQGDRDGAASGGDASSSSSASSSSLPFPPSAVRFAWRAYPCEAHGCGVYAEVEGVRVPPAPFYAQLSAA